MIETLPFSRKVRANPDTGCWEWTGYIDPKTGYASTNRRIAGQRKNVKVHRYAYELLVGPIPSGLVIDHLCRVRHCCNPDHLEPVTYRVNNLRGNSPTMAAYRAGLCMAGRHRMLGENVVVWSNGHRQCRPCRLEHNRDYMRRRRATNRDATKDTE